MPDILQQEGRVPPQSVELEESILGSCLLERAALEIVMAHASEEWFYRPANRHVFQAIRTLYDQDQFPDLLSVEEWLRSKGLLDTIGGSGYISDLTRAVSSAAQTEYHLSIVRNKYLCRMAILQAHNTIKEAYEADADAEEILEHTLNELENLAVEGTGSGERTLHDQVRDTLEQVEKVYGQKGNYIGIPSRLPIDELTSGFQNTDFIVIAGRPSMGKTALVLCAANNITTNPVTEYRLPVAIFSLEMSATQLIKRLIALDSNIEQDYIRSGKISKEEFTKVIEIAGDIASRKLFIDETPAITLQQLKAKARRLVRKHGVGMIIIDYLQLMSGDSKAGNREQEISGISRGLKALAKELNVPVIALSQLSRAVEMRGGLKKPQLSDLRESGSIEQDADVIIFLWRPEYYEIEEYNGQSTYGLAYGMISKQRNGPTGEVKMHFHKPTGRFGKPADPLVEKARNGHESPF